MRSLRSRAVLPLVLALVVPAALAWADERGDSEKALEKAIGAKDKDAVKTALQDATKAGDLRAAKLILQHAPKCRGLDVHQPLINAIRAIKEEAGVKELCSAAKSHGTTEVRYLLVEGLALQGSEAAQKSVLDALDDASDLVQNAAARSSRWLRGPDAIDRLIARLEKAEPKANEGVLARELLGALSALTGENLSFALEWKGWWMSHKPGWKPKNEVPGPDGGDHGSVVERLKKERPGDYRTLEKVKDDDVIVCRGKSDKVEDVLKAINVKHKLIDMTEIKDLKLEPRSLLVLNCNSREQLGEPEINKIRDFVDAGGYLFTSDWQLEFFLAKAFASAVQLDQKVKPDGYTPGGGNKGGAKGGKKPPEGDGNADPEEGKGGAAPKGGGKGGGAGGGGAGGGGGGAGGGGKSYDSKKLIPVSILPAAPKHPLLRDVFPATTWDASSFMWQLDAWSELIKIGSSDVVVLVESPDLKKQYNNGAVAITWRWHKGKVAPQATGVRKSATGGGGEAKDDPEGGAVLHVLGHFKHQKDANSGDHFALQQLLLNFILEKQRSRH